MARDNFLHASFTRLPRALHSLRSVPIPTVREGRRRVKGADVRSGTGRALRMPSHISRYERCLLTPSLPPTINLRGSLRSPLLLSHEIDGVRKEKERLTAIISTSLPLDLG